MAFHALNQNGGHADHGSMPTLNTGNSQWSTPWELVMAGCVIVTLPLIIVFFIFQDQFMSSVTIGAVKE